MTVDDRELLERRLIEPAECVYDPSFRRVQVPVGMRNAPRTRGTIPAVRVSLVYGGPLTVSNTEVLSAADERDLFLRFNFCRSRVVSILRRFQAKRLSAEAAHELVHWERAAQAARTEIVRANTSLVLAMARRSRNVGVELSELVSEGNLALLRCVDKFDTGRGFKFSTYACRAILASFSRAAAKAARHRTQFPASFDPAMERSDYLDRKREYIEQACIDELTEILRDNAAELSAVERRVLDARFDLGAPDRTQTDSGRRTLDQVGMLLGVSKERVRQIQNQAMAKLRAALEDRIRAAS